MIILFLILADALILFEGLLILKLYSYNERLTGSRRELKIENRRLRKEMENSVIRFKMD